MATKVKTITVYPSQVDRDKTETVYTHYRVVRITDSVDYAPGENITKGTLADLCADRHWKVTVVKPD